MHPEYPLFTRQDLVDELPALQENEAFFHAKAWEAIQAGNKEAASNYIDIHADAELKADEVEAHIMNLDFDRRQVWISQHPLTVRTLGMLAVSESYESVPEANIMDIGGSENIKVHEIHKCGNLLPDRTFKPNYISLEEPYISLLKPNQNQIDKD